MKFWSSNRIGLSAVVLAVVSSQVACGSSPREDVAKQSADAPAAPSAAAPKEVELARTQAFLDSRYVASDVQHSFVSAGGDTIDCIDFFAQPGVKELARRGTPITKRPHAVPRYVASGRGSMLDRVAFDGSPDENGSERRCSDTTVPIVRVTADDVARVGGLDAFLHAHTTKPPMTMPTAPAATAPDGAGLIFAHAQASYSGTGTFLADQSTLSIWDPALTTSDTLDHSLMQTWTTSSGSQWSQNQTTKVITPCAPNCQQTVEVGWTVDPGLNSGSLTPHLFVYSTANGYQSGCYNSTIASNAPGGGGACPTWIASPASSFAVGMSFTASTGGSSPVERELTIAVSNIDDNGNSFGASSQANMNQPGWGVWLGTNSPTPVGEVGFYPSSNYTGTFQTAGTIFTTGAEVADSTDANTTANTDTFTLPMGSGSLATAGWGQAAYAHDYEVFQSTGVNRTFSAATATEPEYAVSTTPAAGYFWENYFYVGEAPPATPGSTVGN